MDYNDEELKLIYVLKIGYNTNNEGLFEFVFSINETNVDVEDWCWDLEPACDNAIPPTEEYYNSIYHLRTKDFDLKCLHEAVDRPYMHGYHNIHALAYEIDFIDDEDGYNQYEEMYENNESESPLLVFHYGMSLKNIKDMLYEKKIILKGNEFINASSIKLK